MMCKQSFTCRRKQNTEQLNLSDMLTMLLYTANH